MLRRRSGILMAAVVGLLLGTLFATPSLADGGTGGVQCSPGDSRPVCNVDAGKGGNSPIKGGEKPGKGNGGDGKCRNPSGTEIPCERDGAHAGPDGCYYKSIDVSPATIEALGGQPEGPGGWYQRVCYGKDGTATTGLGGPVWVPGAPPTVSPEELARRARSQLVLPKVEITMNPPGDQLVNLPSWLSLDPASWRSVSATASVPGVSVTATARPVKAVWSMGDGGSVSCDGPGAVWKAGMDPKASSPDCPYTFRRPSSSGTGGRFTVTVTVTWEVTWAGAGQSGTVPGLTTTGAVPVRVQESQAVARR